MLHILKPICTGVLCVFCLSFSYGQFAFSYDGPDTLFVGDSCTAILDWGHPGTPQVFPTLPGQVIISWMIFSISGGYMIGEQVAAGETVTVFYQARDNMGHIALFGFNIVFTDNSPPQFDPQSLPDDVTVACAGEVGMPMIEFSDNCDSDSTMTVLSFDQSGNPEICEGGTILRTWTITDPFGNSSSYMQEITILPDTVSPVITGFPMDGSAPCGAAIEEFTIWLAVQRAAFMADDIGCGITSLTDNAPPPSVLLGFCGELEVAFFANDSCGNSTSVVVSFFVTNDTPPTITIPAVDGMTSCDGGNPQIALQEWLTSHGGADAVDDCSLVTWTSDPESPTLDDVCNGALVVTFIANDGCGNTASTTAEFFVQDDTPPTIAPPAQNVVINCSTTDFHDALADWLTTNGNASATDICTDEDSLQVQFLLNGVMLDSASVVNAFQDSVLNGTCTDGVIVDGFIFNNVLALITLDFVFSDNCGNASSTSGIFAIRDALGPVWEVVPQDSILTCAGVDVETLFTQWYESAGFAVGTDDCGSISYSGMPSLEEALAQLIEGLDTACTSGAGVEVTFQIHDFCGNTNPIAESAVFSVVDSSGPMIVQNPVDVTYTCSQNVQDALIMWLDTLGGAEVQEECGDLDWMFTWTESGEMFSGTPGMGPYPGENALDCNLGLSVTFSATDMCNNTVSATAAFFFSDTIAPQLEVGTEITIPCDSLQYVVALVSDNCTADPVVTFTDINISGDSSQCITGTILRTWIALDDCGNTSTATQVIHIEDSQPPEFVAPMDTIIFCVNQGDIDSGEPTNVADNCDPVPDITFQDSSTGTACDQIIIRRWIITDACDNVSTAIQQIQIRDTMPPALVMAPSDLILECDLLQNLEFAFADWIGSAGGASLSDNCSDVQFFMAVHGSYVLEDTLTWPGTAPAFPMLTCGDDTLASLQVDLVYADDCGNAEMTPLNVFILDTTAPVIEGCLADTTVIVESGKCETEVTLLPPLVFDVCGAGSDTVHMESIQAITSSLPGDSVIVVDTVIFNFNVAGPPVFTFAPVIVEVILSGVDADSITEHFIVYGDDGQTLGMTGSALEECDTVTSSFSIPSSIYNAWSADGSVVLTLVPNTDPGGVAAINDICPGATVTIAITVLQGTQDSLTYAYAIDTLPLVPLDSLEEVTLSLYAGEHLLTWYITDCAGNGSQCLTQISVQDTVPPQISCPADVLLQLTANTGCELPVVLYPPVVSDSCGINAATVQYSITGDTLIGTTIFGDADSVVVLLTAGDFIVEYHITDISGNTASCTFNVTINDPIAPVAVCQPGTAFVHPSGIIPLQVDPLLIDGGSLDNCGIDTMIVVPGIFPCDSAGTGQLVELIVIDDAGNADTCTAELLIEVQAIEPTYTIGLCALDTLHLFANVPPAPGNPYTFSWTGPMGFTSSLENPIIPDVNSTYSGTYLVVVTGEGGCTSMGSVVVTVDNVNAPELIAESATVCEGEPVVLHTTMYNEPVTYRWFRGIAPGGLFLGNTAGPSFSDIPPLPGQYTYYVIVETTNCASNPSQNVDVVVLETPIATVQAPFIEVCEGDTFSLGTMMSGPGITYAWTGPDGFNSTEQFPPPITNADSAHAGTYELIISLDGCMSAPATTNVVVTPRPGTPVIMGDSVFCNGGNLILTVVNILVADQFIWQNPQMNSISTPGNTLTLNNINQNMEGAWTVVAILGDCSSEPSQPFTVVIEDMLPVTASNDGPVCEGSGDSVTLLVPIIPGVSYMWSGPDSFMSTIPNPVVLGVESTYTVTATSSSGCTAISSTTIMVEDPPGITALSNTAGTCADSTQNLTFAVTVFPPDPGAYQYQWTGPMNFSSNLMNPVIPGLTSTLNGTYTLVVSLGSCMSDPVNTEVNVLDAPARPEISGILEYCSGELISLTATDYSGDSVLYIWSTPTGDIESWNNNTLQIDNTTVTNSGAYSVIVQINGCNSIPSDTIDVLVAQVVNQPIAQGPTTVCAGDTLHLSTQFVPGGIYQWTGPAGFISQLQNPVIFPVTSGDSGSYQVIVQVGACVSDISDPVSVTVLPLPLTPGIEQFVGSVCLGAPSPATLCVTVNTVTSGALYTWIYQNTALNDPTSERCVTITDFSVFTAGTNVISVMADLNGCASAMPGIIDIPMYDIPGETADAGPDASYCAGDEVLLNATPPSTGIGSWSSPNNFIVFDNINDPFTGVHNLDEGVTDIIWSLDFESCLNYSSDTITVLTESTPLAVRDSVSVPFGQTVDINVILNDFVPGAYMIRLLSGGPLKGNILYRGQGIFTYDPDLGYVGPDKFTYEICSALCPEQCTMVDVIIQVGDESDCFIPTIFTPNGDGTNDLLIIPCLETERFPQNRVLIFNEWGDAVYEAKPYFNDWDGTREGKDLPVATYFYIIDFGDGRPVQNGFLILER